MRQKGNCSFDKEIVFTATEDSQHSESEDAEENLDDENEEFNFEVKEDTIVVKKKQIDPNNNTDDQNPSDSNSEKKVHCLEMSHRTSFDYSGEESRPPKPIS